MNIKRRWLPVLPAAGILFLVPSVHAELIVNGGFEDPAISGTWAIFDSIPGWQLASGPSIEVQNGVGNWSAFEGNQWIELDSDQNGPGNGHIPGELGSSAIYQDVETIIGQTYLLTFAFSARPGVEDNRLLVQWGDEPIVEAFASGLGRTDTNWELFEITVKADAEVSRITFGDRSVSDTLGTFIDGVSLRVLPGPATLGVLLPCLRARRRRRT